MVDRQKEKCPSSGFIMGGYRDEYADDTIKTMCTDCWRKVDAVPIDPEPRTDLRLDGSLVWVIRKQIVDHEAGNAFIVRCRRDAVGWLFLVGCVGFVFNLIWAVARHAGELWEWFW